MSMHNNFHSMNNLVKMNFFSNQVFKENPRLEFMTSILVFHKILVWGNSQVIRNIPKELKSWCFQGRMIKDVIIMDPHGG
jgi:hypothetical protein